MDELNQIHFSNRKEFRTWLESNHNNSPGIWMVYYKNHTGKACINYREALEEALCFGWIDSIIKRLDDDRYVRKFTPRTDTKKWSELNKRIASELIQKGLMTQAGLLKIDKSLLSEIENLNPDSERKEKKVFEIPAYILQAFAANEPALTNFSRLALSYKKHYVLWISSAKREETRIKRLNEAIVLLKENKKLGLK